MTASTFYISGPMTGYAAFNFPAFAAATDELRRLGLAVVSPAEIDAEHGKPWDFYLRNDIRALMDCTHVAVLPGWECSRGALLEVHIAHALSMPVAPIDVVIANTKRTLAVSA